MPACPQCHIYQGLWSPLKENQGFFVCSVNNMHRFTRDRDGNFHSAKRNI